MHPSSFRRISATISTTLLAALVLVIVLAIRDNPTTALPRLTPTAQVAVLPPAAATTPVTPDATPAVGPTTTSATAIPAAVQTEEAEAAPTAVETAGAGATGAATSTPTAPPDDEPTTAPAGSIFNRTTAVPTSAPTPAATGSPDAPGTNGTTVDIPAAGTRIPPTFDPDKPPTVSIFSDGNFVNGVAPMRSTLWAATGGGVVAWNKSTGSYVKFTTLDGLATNRTVATTVCPLPGLGVLFATTLGIQVFDTQTGAWKTLNSSNSDMQHDDVATLWCNVDAGLLVVGYARNGIDLFDAAAGSWSYVGEEAGLTATGIRDIAVVDEGDAIWLATLDGLYVYRPALASTTAAEAETAEAGEAADDETADEPAGETAPATGAGEVTRYSTANSPLEDNRIETLVADGSGAVWLTSGNILYRTNGESWDTFTAGSGNFPAGRLTGLDVSENGTIWLGSDQTQLCRFDPGVKGCIAFFQGETGMATAPLTGLTIDSEGEVYYTTAGGGISIYDGTQWRQLEIANEITPGNEIRTIVQAAAGEYWVAGNGGAARFVPDGGGVQRFSPANSPLPAVDVRAILPVEDGVWVGSNGAAFYDGTTWTLYTEEDGLAGPLIQAIAADSQKRIWLGTSRGLSIWTGNTFFNLTRDNGLPNDDITALQADGDAVWIGTRGGGLLRFQDNQLQLFNRSNSNLPGDIIYELARTQAGQLLVGTDRGMARFADNRLTRERALEGETVLALAAMPSGEVWAATAAGELHTFDGIEWTLATLPRLPAPAVTELFVDADGALWVGAAQGGMARYTP